MKKPIQDSVISTFITFLILTLFLFTSCEEQKEYDLLDPSQTGYWEEINTNDGLPGNSIRDIKLDSKGNLWVACYGSGVSKYNGSGWTTYNTSNSGILSNNITCIEEDHEGDMWFGTRNGISFLADGTSWIYFQDPDNVYDINTIKRDSHGWVWVGTDGQGYLCYDGSNIYASYPSPQEELNVINTIEEDQSGNIWMGTDLGILIWDWSAWSWQSVQESLGSSRIWSLFCDSKGNMWIGARGGDFAGYSKNMTVYPVPLFNGDLSSYIKDIFEDRNGDIWFATWFDGLIRYNGVYCEAFKEYNGFPEDDVQAIAGDKNGNIWAGTYSEGLAKYTLPLTIK